MLFEKLYVNTIGSSRVFDKHDKFHQIGRKVDINEISQQINWLKIKIPGCQNELGRWI